MACVAAHEIYFTKIRKVKKMTDVIKLDLKSFQDMCKTIEELTQENQELKLDNDFLQRQVNALRLNNRAVTEERNQLADKLNRMSIWDLSPDAQEEAGHLLARSLLGGK